MGEFVVRDYLAVGVQFADTSSDKLRGLTAEVEDNDFLLHILVYENEVYQTAKIRKITDNRDVAAYEKLVTPAQYVIDEKFSAFLRLKSLSSGPTYVFFKPP